MNYNIKNIIIDCDPGIDDALALAFAMSRPEFNILGITTVSGNAHVSKTCENALRLTELMGKGSIPVYEGCESPLARSLGYEGSSEIHGDNGLGNIELPPSKVKKREERAEDFIINTLLSHEKGNITLVTLGPLTNIAKAIQKNPTAVARAKDIFSMGGAVLCGNITPVAEFNYWADPEAAEVVFKFSVPVYMIGLNVTETVRLKTEHMEIMKSKGNSAVKALASMMPVLFDFCNRYEDCDSLALHDLVAMEACLAPELFDFTHCTVQISTTNVTRGECVADIVDAWKQPKNCFAAMSAKGDELVELFFRTMLPDMDTETK